MATQNLYTGDGTANQVFNITFEYLDDDDIKVEIKDTTSTTDAPGTNIVKDATNGWELITPTSIRLKGTLQPVSTDRIRIYRETDIDQKAVTYASGSAIRAQDLNLSNDQVLFSVQEWRDQRVSVYGGQFRDDLDMDGNQIYNLGDANSDDDAVNRGQLAGAINEDITFTDGLTKSATSTGGTNSGIQFTVSIPDGTLDFDKIKAEDVIVETEQDQASPAPADNNIFSAAAIAKRSDTILTNNGVLPTVPSPGSWQNGKFLYDSSPGSEVLKIWTGSTWVNVSAGVPFTPPTSANVLYVNPDPNIGNDYNSGSSGVLNRGVLPQRPLRTIKGAVDLINSDFDVNDGNGAQGDGDGTLIILAAGVYQETLPIVINKNDVSIVGIGLRSTFVQPTQATESNTMFEVNSGTLLANMTFVGLKASGTRGNSTYDSDSTYGLPENQGWVAAFKSGATIRKSPYIQNCTSFNDSTIDNSVAYDPQNLALNADGLGGDTTSAMTGGGILCDGSTPASTSPLRSFVVDSFTQVNLDGPGILCTNNGYAQLVSFFGTFCHYHAKALNGGQLNLSNCTTDFGRYGLIADGKSATNIFYATADGTTAAGQITFTITGTTAVASWHGDQTNPRPLDNMLVQLGGNADGTGGTIYPILSSAVNGSGYDVTISNPDPTDFSNNLGLAAQLTTGTTVRFFLRSQISTGGHTFEYCGSGTDYSGHPDNGGVAVLATQAVELNDGKVWQSSTDENGRFAVGNTFVVDQKTGAIEIAPGALNVVEKTGPTGSAIMPAGTTALRDASPANGYLRYNTTNNEFEGYINGSWSFINGYADAEVDLHLNRSTASSGEILSWNGSDYDWVAGYADAEVDAHLNRSTASSGEILSWNGSDYDWVAQASGGGTVNDGDYGDITVSSSGATWTIDDDVVTYAKMQNVSTTNRLIGRTSAGAGDPEEITPASARTMLNVADGANNYTHPNHSGDVTSNADGATTIADDAVTYAKMQDLVTANRVLGGTAAGTIAEVQVTGDMIADDTITEAKLDVHDTPATGEVLGYTANGLEWVAQGGGGGVDDLTDGYRGDTGSGLLFSNFSLGHTGTPAFTGTSSNGTGNCVINNAATTITSGAHNTLFGIGAGDSLTTQDNNAFIGWDAGSSCTGDHNNGMGYKALRDTTADNNTAMGHFAGSNIVGGSHNTAVGSSAMSCSFSDGNGIYNVAVGSNACDHLDTGSYNVAVGSYALYGSTTTGIAGSYNIAIGNTAIRAGTSTGFFAAYNIGIGHDALRNLTGTSGSQTDGADNIALGQDALYNLTTGASNIAIGENAGQDLTTSSNNICIGNSAGKNKDVMNMCIAIGHEAMLSHSGSTLNENIGIGYRSLQDVSTGGYNVCMGRLTGASITSGGRNTCIGMEAGYGTSTGNYNTFVGSGAGLYLNGYYNVAIGSDANNTSSATNSNTITIGYLASPSTASVTNQITLGNSNISTLRCNTQTISSLSDGRDKTEVEDLPLGLDFIDSLRPVKFKWETREGVEKDGTYDAGFIAQDLQSAQTNSDAEYLNMVLTSNPDRLEAAYGRLIPVLVQAIKDLKSEIDTLKANV